MILDFSCNVLKALIKNKTVLLVFSYVALLGTILILYSKYNAEKNEVTRLENNQRALSTDIEYFKTKSGDNAARVIELELTKKEFEELCKDQMETIRDLGIKVKRLENISTTVSKTEVSGSTVLVDTVIFHKNDTVMIPSKAKKFVWSDEWNRISGIIEDDTVNCMYEGMDTLTIVCTKVPKKFLFLKWGCKHVEADITNKNKSNHILYNRTVKLK